MPSLQRARSVLTRRRFLAGSAFAAAATAAYAAGIERHILTTVRKTVSIRNLPEAFHGFRIAQLSDFHFKNYDEPFFVKHAVDTVNEIAPDMVALTGDFITAHFEAGLRRNMLEANACAEILREIKCPLRVCTLGNHDAASKSVVVDALRANNLLLLENRHMALDVRGDRMWVAGLADAYYDVPALPKAIPTRTAQQPVVLLGHEPDFAVDVERYGGVDLMLAGHTHGGQVRLPFLPPTLLPAMGQIYVEGLYTVGPGTQLYVNRGLGCMHLPFRLNCPPELTVLTLQPA